MSGIPTHELSPIFQPRHPLGKGFPAHGSAASSRPKPKGGSSAVAGLGAGASGAAGLRSQGGGAAGAVGHASSRTDRSVQNEYIRNLQQQIYLLELETRYLAAYLILGAAFSQDALEEVEPRPKARMEIEKLKDERKQVELALQTVTKERDELIEDVKSIKERHATEKDKIYGELIATKKKHETALSEARRSEVSYKRVLQEKERLEGVASEARDQANELKSQVDEQLQINASLKARINDLLHSCSSLQAKLKSSEATIASFNIDEHAARIKSLDETVRSLQVQLKQSEHDRATAEAGHRKAQEDIKDLVKKTIDLTHERDELRHVLAKEREDQATAKRADQDFSEEFERHRHELERLKDDLGMIKIACDNKDRKISDLQSQIKSNEAANNKNIEAKIVLTERVAELESLLRHNELDLIQVGQDKSLLTDDVAELKNQLDLALRKMATLNEKNNSLSVELERYKRDLKTLQNFASVLDQVESNGQNYLQLMRDMRKYLEIRE
ncbi:hypothetical protein HK105_206924 [Polyrhizophydium stewartii]|uniref:Uncharacterized protein n=1 Tax=Polyrhizophydium stewartii TaxID=2732419 RepID=A0ABR4N2B1_9FUNG